MSAPPIRATFSLVDHHGVAVSERSYVGRWQLVQFGFTSCKVVCPRALGKLDEMLDLLGANDNDDDLDNNDAAAAVVPLYVTVDPERDSPAVMKRHLESLHPRFTGLTGTAAQTDDAARSFRVFTRRRDADDGYDVQHTAVTYLLDPDARPALHWPDTRGADEMAADLRRLVRSWPTPSRRTEPAP